MNEENSLATHHEGDAEDHIENEATTEEEATTDVEVDLENVGEDFDEDEFWKNEELPEEPIFEEPTSEKIDEPADDDESTDSDDKLTENGVLITKPLKYKGREIFITNEDEAIALMQKGLGYEMKMSKIKPLGKIADIVAKGNVTAEEIQALADAKAGNSEALDYLSRQFGLKHDRSDESIFDDEEEPSVGSEYTPHIEESNPILEIIDAIKEQDPKAATNIIGAYEEVPDTFKAELSNPQVFQAFAADVMNGMFDNIYPSAIKEKAANPALTWIQAYQTAYAKQQSASTVSEKKSQPPKAKKTKSGKRSYQKQETYESYWDKDLDELEKIIFS